MALNNSIISTIIAIFILSIFIGEATIADPPETQKKVSPEASSTSPECAKEYINSHLNSTNAKTREFLKNNIEKRLHDPSFGQADKKCLMRCFTAYHAAIASIERATVDVSKNEFSNAIIDVVAYSSFIGSSMKLKCSSNVVRNSSDFSAMQKWAESSVNDLLRRLKMCTK